MEVSIPAHRKASWLAVALLVGCATGPLTSPSPALLPSALPPEIDSLRGSGVVAQDCDAEATALKVKIPGVE